MALFTAHALSPTRCLGHFPRTFLRLPVFEGEAEPLARAPRWLAHFQFRDVTLALPFLPVTTKKETIRQSKEILDIETANGIVVSDPQAKHYMKDLDDSLWVHLVENSPLVLLFGRTVQ